ncbi:type III pantothenate kinase [Gemmiger formicilis]|uniref:type III pantothenate kinase n=1 Tax=Gemmiger formicilis TaxID=745368 RepID=UPI0035208803
MILALNIGNSNITFGGYTPDGKLVFSSRLFADTALSSDELLYKIVNMLALYGAEPQQITAVIFSSVVPALTPRLREALRKMCECQIMEVGPGLKSGGAHPHGQPGPAGRRAAVCHRGRAAAVHAALRGGEL